MASGLELIATKLAEQGYAVQPHFLDPSEVMSWSEEVLSSFRAGELWPAGVGRGGSHRVLRDVRGDDVRWLDPKNASAAERRYFDRMELLRQALNRELYLGLLELEAHLAVYPAGACYRCHLDRFREENHRAVSTALYLNPVWRPEDEGPLRLYLGEPESEPYEDILPIGGTLVCFFSERFHHEVLPSRRERLSATGWFKRRG